MKRNFLKSMMSFAVLIAVLVSVMPAVMADNIGEIGTLPFYHTFDEYGKEDSWNFYLHPSYFTGLRAFTSGNDMVKPQIKYDSDETHGLVYYMERPADYTDAGFEAYIFWQLPEVTSGRFVFEFDAKVAGTTGFVFTANQTDNNGWNPVVNVENNAISSGGQILSTYNSNEWKSFKLLFDNDNNTVTTFIDGESTTITSTVSKPRAMKFLVWAGGAMSLDNIGAYLVDDSIHPNLVLEENGENAGLFVSDETDSLVLSLDNAEFGTLPEVTVSCLGEDIMSDVDDYDFEVSTQFSEGKIIITPEDYFEVGSRYVVTVADGTTDVFGRTVSITPIVFDVAENDGWITSVENNDDFENETTASIAPGGRFGNDRGDGWKSWAWVGGTGGSAEVLEGSDYSGGKAVKLTGGGQLQFGPGKTFGKGKIHFKTKMDIGVGSQFSYDGGEWPWCRLFHGQSIDITGDSVADNTIDFMYQGTETQLWDNWKLKTGLDTIEYTMDLDNLKSEIVFNGEVFEAALPVNDTLNGGGYDYLTSGKYFRGFRILANELIIDYFNLCHEYTPAVVKSIKATNVADGKVDVKSQLVITFSEAMKEDTLSNITIKNGEENAEYTGVWDATANTYTLTFKSKLKPETEYAVTIPNTVQDYSELPVYEAFGTFITAPIPPMDVENLVAVRNETEVSVTADVVNPANGTVYMVVAGYKDYVMKTIEILPVITTESTTVISQTVTLETNDVDMVKAFALYDMLSIKPYCAAVIAD